MSGALYFALFLSFFALINGQNYCALKSCQNGRHTMCRYTSSKPASACGTPKSTSLTNAEKTAILNRHNELRAYVASGQETRGNPGPQPRAKNLGPLQWNSQLEQIAQRWALQCYFNHDECRNTPNWSGVGQNIANVAQTDDWKNDSLIQMVNSWYDEVNKFNRNSVKSIDVSDGQKVGHYTQMVWAKSTSLGCGAMRYRTKNQWYETYLVCNYGPGGNMGNQPVYETQ